MNRTVKDLALLLSVSAAVFFTGLGVPRLWDRDEPRNASCAAEMLVANDWVTPVFNGTLRTHKPILTYWFMMVAYSLWGVTEFAARFPSALLGTGTCLLTYFMGRRLFGRAAGMWAGIVLATSLMFGIASRAATPDAPLIFFSTLALAVFVWGTTKATKDDAGSVGFQFDFPSHWPTVIAMYAVMGVAVLAKGPVGLILPTAVIGMFLLIRRLPEVEEQSSPTWRSRIIALLRPFAPLHFLRTCWSMRPVTAILAATVVALPWYVWVHLRTNGEWTYGFFVTHNLSRATSAMEGHSGIFLYYAGALLVGTFPWSIFAIPIALESARQLRTRSHQSVATLFAICWVGVYVVLFSFAKTKLPSYITPCYPGVALLTGAFLQRWTSGQLAVPPLWRRLAFSILMLVGVGIAIALPVLSWIFLPGEEFLGAVGLILIVGGIAAWQCAERGRFPAVARIVTLTAVLFTTSLFSLVAIRVDRHRHVEDLVAGVFGRERPDNVEVGSMTSTESSWVFYCRQPIQNLSSPEEAAAFLESAPSGMRRVVLTTTRRLNSLEDSFVAENYQSNKVPYFMEKDDIVILSPRSEIMQTSFTEEANALR